MTRMESVSSGRQPATPVAVAATRVAMLVVSCDRYADMWAPCFRLLDKYWPDREFDMYLMTNTLGFSWPGVSVIRVGDDVSYADNLRAAVAQIPHEWILLWLEDLLVSAPVDNRRVMSMIEATQRRSAGYLKLSPDMPLSYDTSTTDEVGPVPKGVKYRAAIGASFYRRSTLEQLLMRGASAWDLDRSTVCDELPEEFLSLKPRSASKPPVPYVNALIKGKWSVEALPFLRSEGFADVLLSRRRESGGSVLYRRLYALRLLVMRLFRVHWR